MAQGGAEKLLFDIAGGDGDIFEHHVVTLLSDQPFFQLAPARMHSLGVRRGRLALKPLSRLREHVKLLCPDVVHAWLYHGNFFSMFVVDLGAPIIWSIHNTTLSPRHSKRLTRLVNRICAPLSRRIPARIVYCADLARRLHEGIGYDPGRGLVIENGVDVEAFRFDPAARLRLRRTIGLNASDFAVGCIARFDAQKNHRMVIEAFCRVCAMVPAQFVLA